MVHGKVPKVQGGVHPEHFSPDKLTRPWPCDDETAAELILGAVARVKESAKPQFEDTSNVGAWRLRVR